MPGSGWFPPKSTATGKTAGSGCWPAGPWHDPPHSAGYRPALSSPAGEATLGGSRTADGTNILAIDLGSSSARASLYDAQGNVVEGGAEQLSHSFEATQDGGAVADADRLVDLVARAIDGALSRRGDVPVSAVAVTTFWHSLLGLDAQGRPTTPVFTWADRRAAGAAAELRKRLDEAEFHRRNGCVFHSSYWPAKLLWLSEADPDAFARTERFVSPGEYLFMRLFGEASVGTSMASATGLFDQNRKAWDGELTGALPIRAGQLSPISDEPQQGLTGEWGRRWPALADVPWFPAVGDGAASNVGSGCTTCDRLALMVGTSGAMRVLWKADCVEIPPGLWCYRPDAGRFVMGGALSDGGNLIGWLRETMRLPGEEEVEKEIAAMPPDSHGLTFLPLFAGERGPQWADQAHGTISGLSLATRPVDILRAAMEAIAHRFALVAEVLESSLSGERRVIATGGGMLGSPAWAQIMADSLGKPVTVSDVGEASSRGAALLALEALGEIGSIEEVEAPLGETFEPDPERHGIYLEARARQRKLYEAVL